MACGRGLTGSWSKGRSDYYAYNHCRPGCRGVNVTKSKLEALFTDEPARLRPTPGCMRLLKESVLAIWKARQASIREDLAPAQRTADAIQQKLDRLDEAFLFQRSTDVETYDRHAERLREELTLARIAKHSTELDELDVEGILAFAECVLTRAADLWVRPRSSSASGSNSCSSRRDWPSTASGSLEPRRRAGFQLLAGDSPCGGCGGGPDRDRRLLAEAGGLSRVPASRSGPPDRT